MENKQIQTNLTYDTFRSNLGKYEKAVAELLGNKYGFTPQEFLVKVSNAIRKNPELLRCSSQSLFGSILYFAEIGLPFNTPEGFGYISTEFNEGVYEAVPIIGYRGLIEIAYRNPKIKSIRIQAVYEGDEFEYEYGTEEYIKHKPNIFAVGERKLIAVYAIVKIQDIDPLFVVVHKAQLDELKKISKSSNEYAKNDVFNIMESKVAIKLLFKMLPKTNNESLMKVLELDNKFDYDKTTKIIATEKGYELVETEGKTNVLLTKEIEPIEIYTTLPETETSTPKTLDDVKKELKETVDKFKTNDSEQVNKYETKVDNYDETIRTALNDVVQEQEIVEFDLGVIEKNTTQSVEIQKETPVIQIIEPIEIEPVKYVKIEPVKYVKKEKSSIRNLFKDIIEVIEPIDLTNK
jgi:recombination protein RecT